MLLALCAAFVAVSFQSEVSKDFISLPFFVFVNSQYLYAFIGKSEISISSYDLCSITAIGSQPKYHKNQSFETSLSDGPSHVYIDWRNTQIEHGRYADQAIWKQHAQYYHQ